MTDTPDTPTDTPETTDTPPTGEVGVMGEYGYTLSLGEAVRVTGAARSTLQRRLAAGVIEGAARTADGVGWAIPVMSLIRAGYMPKVSDPPPPVPTGSPGVEVDSEADRLRAEVDRLRVELDHMRELAEDRARHVADLRTAMEAMSRALSAGPPPTPVTAPTPEPVTTPPVVRDPGVSTSTPARRWRWRR